MNSNPGFKVTVYLQVEYLNNGATLLNSTTHNYRTPGALSKTCKKLGVVVEYFPQEGRKFSCLHTIGRYGEGRTGGRELQIGSPEGTSDMTLYARVLTNCLLPLMSTIFLILTAMNSIV